MLILASFYVYIVENLYLFCMIIVLQVECALEQRSFGFLLIYYNFIDKIYMSLGLLRFTGYWFGCYFLNVVNSYILLHLL